MKKLMKSLQKPNLRSVQSATAADYVERFTINHGQRKFMVYFNMNQGWNFSASVSAIHPYDNAEYTWAKIQSNGQVIFINDGEIVDKLQLPAYDEEFHEDVNDYIKDMLDSVAMELIAIDKDVKPMIDYT